jgi:4-aminobutyrate aminotransferase-like enzyme
VLDVIKREALIDRVRVRGTQLRDDLEQALADVPIVAEVRGHG